jgi:tRNA-Thr(GGU) m(6)t(6)A37 methyltransferase TsaA
VQLQPVGRVVSERQDETDTDFWGGVVARIELAPELGDRSLAGLADFSHVEVLFGFDRITPREHYRDVRPARGRADLPAVGVFAGRGPNRPNPIGVTICELVEVGDTYLTVRGLDAVDGTPVFDLKPVMRTFLPPAGSVRQPAWADVLMRDYRRERGAVPVDGESLRPPGRSATVQVLQEGYIRQEADGQHVGSTVGLVMDGDVVVVVDPGLVADRRALLAVLRDHGTTPDQVTDVVISHHHPDHTVNIALFPQARVHDHWAVYEDDLWTSRDAHGADLSGSVRLVRTPGHTAEDISTLVGTSDGVIAFTHAWWTADGPVADPYAPDPDVLARSRELLAAAADVIIPGHGPAFPADSAPMS